MAGGGSISRAGRGHARVAWVGAGADKLDALAGLRPRLLSDVAKLPRARILDGQFTGVQQAIRTQRKNAAGAEFLAAVVEEAKKSGLVARLIERHKVKGLSVALPA